MDFNSIIVNKIGEFVAEGIALGRYGNYGQTDVSFLHVYIVDKRFAYNTSAGFSLSASFIIASEPYTAPDIGTNAPLYLLLGEVRDITILVGEQVTIHIFPRGLSNYVAEIETDVPDYARTLPSNLTLASASGIISGTVIEDARTGSPTVGAAYTITFTAVRSDGTSVTDVATFLVLLWDE